MVMENTPMQPRNYMEVVVEQCLAEELARNTPANIVVRQSPQLVAAVMARVLNNVRPFYVTGKVGEVYGFSAGAVPQNKTDIMIEIVKAIEVLAEKGYTKEQ